MKPIICPRCGRPLVIRGHNVPKCVCGWHSQKSFRIWARQFNNKARKLQLNEASK